MDSPLVPEEPQPAPTAGMVLGGIVGFGLAFLSLAALYGVVCFFFPQLDQRAKFGESMGTLECVVAAIGIVGLLLTLRLQQHQLQMQRQEIDQARRDSQADRVEAMFFRFLEYRLRIRETLEAKYTFSQILDSLQYRIREPKDDMAREANAQCLRDVYREMQLLDQYVSFHKMILLFVLKSQSIDHASMLMTLQVTQTPTEAKLMAFLWDHDPRFEEAKAFLRDNKA